MTLELFLKDAYLREFEARVVRIDGREIVLDRTAFFPGGGGQPADKGTLGIGPIQANVIDARREGDSIIHILDKPIPDTVRDLKGALDWNRRYAHMRYHTALHALSAIVGKEYDARVTGGQIRPDRARMDFSFPGEWTADVVQNVQYLTNKALADNCPVKVYESSREESFANADRLRTETNLVPERVQTVRIVEIEGIDAQADVGTHVSNTSEVGRVEVTGHKSTNQGNKRIEFVL